MKRHLEQFYESFGDRGIMFILYAFSVVVNALLTFNMDLPAVYPDEIAVAGTAAMYSGIAQWPLLGSAGGGSGYIQALFYAPLYRVFNNQFALYKTMLVVNSLLISFIPMIIYHLAAKLGVARVHQKLIIAISCGMYISYIVDSKYIWNETVMALMCWLIMLCFFNAWDKKGKSSRFANSMLLGFLCALANAAGTRLIALTAALVITILIAMFAFREKIVSLPVFAASLVLSFFGEHLVREMLPDSMRLSRLTVNGGGAIGKMFTHLYAFTTTTLGIGALAAAITAIMLLTLVREGTRRKVEKPESNTKIYEPVKHKYSLRLTLFALFQFLAVMCTGIYSALFDASADGSAVTERLTDNLAPLALFLVLVFVYLYGTNLKQVLIGVGIYGYVCICFAAGGCPINTASGSVSGLLPISFIAGESSENMTYIIMSSCVFTMFAMIIVFVFCSRRHRTVLVTTSTFLVMVLSTAYLGGAYLPAEAKASTEELEPFRAVADLLYNDVQSPPIIVYETDPRLAATIQFLAPNTKVSLMESDGKAPEDCLLVAENGKEFPFYGVSYENVGRTDKYTVYAFGESARDFMRYSSSKN